MGTQAEREGVSDAFRKLFLSDKEKGEVKELAHYKGLFPGFWDVVGEEFDAIARAGQPGGRTVVAGRALDDTTPGAAVVVPDAVPETAVERIGPYRVLKELGRGGMGVVYLAEDTRIGRKVALKVLAAHFSSSRQLLLRFQREAELAGKLDHPHICTVYEAGEADGTAYMAMRLVEGKPLSEWIGLSKEAKRPSGVVTLPPLEERKPDAKGTGEQRRDLDRILTLIEKAARALHAAHEKGLIHRDIKPHNIMVTPEGEPVLLDFGLAREEEGEGQQLTQTGSLMGTPAYMSPEQLTAARIKLDRRTDVYSLGATLYECLTLRLPFEAPTLDGLYQKILTTDPEDPRRLNQAIPRDLEVVVATALEKDRDRRYQSAEALAEELRRVREHEPIQARPVGPLERLGRWAQRNPALGASLSGTFIALALGLGVSLWFLGEARRHDTEKSRALEDVRAIGLVHASTSEGARNPILGLLLAREAVRVHPDSQVAMDRLRAASLDCHERVRFRGHQGPVVAAGFSPAGDRVLTASSDGTARIWDLGGREIAVLRGHKGTLESALFSETGDRVLTHGTDGTARLWDAGGRQLLVLGETTTPGKGDVTCAALAPGADRILTGSRDGTAGLWSPSGERIATLSGHSKKINWVGYSPTGDRVLTASEDATARLWDSSGAPLLFLSGHKRAIRSAVFSPSGDRILTLSPSGLDHHLWDIEGHELAVIMGQWTAAEFMPDGGFVTSSGYQARLNNSKGAFAGYSYVTDGQPPFPNVLLAGSLRVLLAYSDGSARLLDLLGHEVSPLLGHEREVVSACLSPSGECLLTASQDGTACLWDLDRHELGSFSFADPGPPSSPSKDLVVPWSPFAAAGCLWKVVDEVAGGHSDLARRPFLPREGYPPGNLYLQLDEKDDQALRVLNIAGAEVARLGGHQGPMEDFAFSPCGDRVLTLTNDGSVGVWDLGGKQVALWPGREPRSFEIQMSPAGDRIVAIDTRGHALVRDLSGAEIARLDLEIVPVSDSSGVFVDMTGHSSRMDNLTRRRLMKFSPSGHWVAGPTVGDSYTIWRASDGEVRAVVRGHGGPVRCIAFSPDEETVATASEDGTARLWNLSGKELAVLQGHQGAVRFVAFSPGGDRIITGSTDRTGRVWDLHGNLVATLPVREGEVDFAAVSPSGDRYLTHSPRGAFRAWAARNEDVVRIAEARILRGFTRDERRRLGALLLETVAPPEGPAALR